MRSIFGKKKTASFVDLTDARGKSVFCGALDRLVIPEEVILDMSVEFFGDPEPCTIHRAAVMARAFEEIRAGICAQTEVACLPERLRRYFGIYDAFAVRVEEWAHGA